MSQVSARGPIRAAGGAERTTARTRLAGVADVLATGTGYPHVRNREPTMNIENAAERSGLPAKTIRYY